MKYIDSIEIERVKDEIVIKKININKKEIMNIGYMFRNDCFDMAININDRDIILSNEKTKDDIDKYINSLSKFYNISPITIEKDKLNLGELDKLMDTEGEIIVGNINDIFKDLGLNKNINITVDKHSVPHKFAYSIKNHKDVNELSDGQKHKLALAIFMNSIITDDLTDKVIVIDDPVVSLDISSYILFKQFLITKLIKDNFKDSTRLILLTHDITYLYIQLSNIFNDIAMKNDTVVYKLSSNNIIEIPIDYIKTDDISLFKLAMQMDLKDKKFKFMNTEMCSFFMSW